MIKTEISTGGFLTLGLLLDSPLSGYDIVLAGNKTIGHFWTITKAHVYRELPRLLELGWVSAEEIEQSKRPDKKVYSITESGGQAFRKWLSEVDFGETKLRHPLLLKLFFAAELTDDELLHEFAKRQDQINRSCENLLTLKKTAQKNKDKTFKRKQLARIANINYGIARLDAESLWLTELTSQFKRVID